MAGKNTAVYGIYRNVSQVEGAVDTLREQGFRNTDISVLLPENAGTKDFAHKKIQKHLKALPPARDLALSWAAHLDG